MSLRALTAVLSPAQRRQLLVLFALMLAGGVAELTTVVALVPFLGGLVGTEPAFVQWLPDLAMPPLPLAATIFVGAVLAAGLIRLLLLAASQRLVFGFGHDLTVETQRRILAQPYLHHVQTHSSGAIAALEKVELLVFGTLLPLLQAAAAAILSLSLLGAMLQVDPWPTLAAAALFALLYVATTHLTRRRVHRAADVLASTYEERVRCIQESQTAIRDIILSGTRDRTIAAFRLLDSRLTAARVELTLTGGAPRIVIETLGIIAIALLAALLAWRDGSLAAALPTLGALALGAQRLLPLLQTLYQSWVNIHGNRTVAADVLALLHLPLPSDLPGQPIPFTDRIEIDTVSFTYPGREKPAVHDISLTIPRGSRVALTGRTGSGKSTLADLVMGLLVPQSGAIRIDSHALNSSEKTRSWQRNIAHVPQKLAIIGQNLAEFVTSGHPEAPPAAVREALQLAHLDDFVTALPQGLDTPIGEHGLLLSGGQRQRLALARAILRNAPLLVLDEPTSALDPETEAAIADTLDILQQRGTTILIIAHSPALVSSCDLIVRLENGRICELSGPVAEPQPRCSRSQA